MKQDCLNDNLLIMWLRTIIIVKYNMLYESQRTELSNSNNNKKTVIIIWNNIVNYNK